MKRKRAWQLLQDNLPIILFLFALNLLLLIPAAMEPIFKQVFTDYVLAGGATEWLPSLLALMLGAALFSATLTWMQKNCIMRLANKIELAGSGRYIWRLICSPLELFNKKDSFRLLTSAGAARGVSKILTRDLLGLMFNIVSAVFYFIMMLRLDFLMSAVVVALIIVVYLLNKLRVFLTERFISDDDAPDPDELAMRDERIGSIGLENIEAFKSTASETHFIQRMLGSKLSLIDANRAGAYEDASYAIETLPEVIFLNLLLLISVLRIMNRDFSVGSYLAFAAYAGAFFYPLSETLGSFKIVSKLEKRLKGLYRELAVDQEDDSDFSQAPDTCKLNGGIEVRNLCFEYEKGVTVLDDISFSVPPGGRLAIVGDSGAGKSTLLAIIEGMYKPTSGSVSIDGFDPTQIDRRAFASSVGSAHQSITLFSATIRDNITLWDETVSDEEVYAAASDACIHEYVATLEGAYEYCLPENGKNLSGGQQQRIEIARALLYQPTIVLFDEATGSIDPQNRVAIEKNLIRRGVTCIAVTHVLSEIEMFDEILLLHQGKIVARGTHRDLLNSSREYNALYHGEEAAR